MRTIDADALKEAFEMDGYLSPYTKRMIDACPTVEAVEVVRCARCVRAEHNRLLPEGVVWCDLWEHTMQGIGYCHEGEQGGET